jgi:hypothetical protein
MFDKVKFFGKNTNIYREIKIKKEKSNGNSKQSIRFTWCLHIRKGLELCNI